MLYSGICKAFEAVVQMDKREGTRKNAGMVVRNKVKFRVKIITLFNFGVNQYVTEDRHGLEIKSLFYSRRNSRIWWVGTKIL